MSTAEQAARPGLHNLSKRQLAGTLTGLLLTLFLAALDQTIVRVGPELDAIAIADEFTVGPGHLMTATDERNVTATNRDMVDAAAADPVGGPIT